MTRPSGCRSSRLAGTWESCLRASVRRQRGYTAALAVGKASRSVDDDLAIELNKLQRRIAADEYKITLARAAGGNNANKMTLEEDLKRRILEATSRMDALRVQPGGTRQPPT